MNLRDKIYRSFWFSLILAATFFSSHKKSSWGQELIDLSHFTADSIPAVKNLLTELWSKELSARNQSNQTFAEMDRPSQATVLAFVANRLNDNQPREALAALDQSIHRDPQFLDGLLIRAHLNLRLRNFDQALVDLRSIVRLMDKVELNDVQKNAVFYRIGRMVGFLEGPVSHRVNQDLLNRLSNEIPNFAGNQQFLEIRKGVDEVLQIYAQMVEQVDQRFEVEIEAQARVNENLQQNLTEENQNLQQVLTAITDQMAQVRNEANQREAQLSAQFAPIEANLYNLERQMAAAQLDLSFLYTELAIAQSAPVICHITLRLLRDRIRVADLNLLSIRNSFAVATGQLNSLQVQIQQVQLQAQQQLQNLNREMKQASGKMNRNQRQLTRIAGGPAIDPQRREAILNRTNALSTYIQLTPSAIRQDLLDHISKLEK